MSPHLSTFLVYLLFIVFSLWESLLSSPSFLVCLSTQIFLLVQQSLSFVLLYFCACWLFFSTGIFLSLFLPLFVLFTLSSHDLFFFFSNLDKVMFQMFLLSFEFNSLDRCWLKPLFLLKTLDFILFKEKGSLLKHLWNFSFDMVWSYVVFLIFSMSLNLIHKMSFLFRKQEKVT